MEDKVKKKLKRRGNKLYLKYFFNSHHIIKTIIEQYDLGNEIDDSICEVVFNVPESYSEQIYELILFYPKKLKEIKIITEDIIKELYIIYGETIEIMKETKLKTNKANVRGKITQTAQDRAKKNNIECNITSEDIILTRNCPILNIRLEYGNDFMTNKSASLDRVIPNLGYIKGNVKIISMLANKMKSDANKDELITFANNIIRLYT